jgi:hypothetical protein
MVLLESEGRRYETIRASSIGYGMGVELWDITEGKQEQVLFAFQFDTDGRVEFSCYREGIPFRLVEVFVHEVRNILGPKVTNEPGAVPD